MQHAAWVQERLNAWAAVFQQHDWNAGKVAMSLSEQQALAELVLALTGDGLVILDRERWERVRQAAEVGSRYLEAHRFAAIMRGEVRHHEQTYKLMPNDLDPLPEVE